jgi:hypothetical protein
MPDRQAAETVGLNVKWQMADRKTTGFSICDLPFAISLRFSACQQVRPDRTGAMA